ncbi:MAG: winged helix-turn-helix transcriptional regulator [candidate division Zixibacteria bacterium]|nr:winged helix-turn-helix transcriptional regulator [candidate division Zixibacteria bacterium]
MVEMDEETNFETQALMLKALAHPTRLRIVEILSKEAICVKHIGDLMDVPQATLSQHLSVLRNSGIVACCREGNRICYSIRDTRASYILETLKKDKPREKKAG